MARPDRPPVGEELNVDGEPTTPRRAASVIVLRGGDRALEVLLVRRSPRARVMGGVWVFPGGAVEHHEGGGDAAHRAAAVRELAEEAGIAGVAPDALVTFSRWITPAAVRRRFDTHFFLASLPGGAQPRVDGRECVDLRWFTPQAALDAHGAGEIRLVFPTIRHLEQLAALPSAYAALEHAARREVRPVLPRIVVDGETARVLLPGEPGYETPAGEGPGAA